jgi:hypothetical protein
MVTRVPGATTLPLPRLAAAFDTPAGGVAEAPEAAAGDSFTDPQGRTFHRRGDPATGHVYWEHAREQSDQAGNRLRTEAVLDVAPEGSIVRTELQRLERAGGDVEQVRRQTSFSPQGERTSEVTDSLERTRGAGGVAREERSTVTGTFREDKLVAQHMDMDVEERLGDPGDIAAQSTEARTKLTADWDNGGAPITQETVPRLRREQTVRYSLPNEGLHKGQPRVITTTQVASGTPTALVHEPMALVVRFQGRGGQFMERHLQVPVDANGEPDMARAKTVKDIDGQHLLDKGLLQARIWGGFASSLAVIVGANLIRTPMGGLGKGLVGAGLLASTAALGGEVHAQATGRTDASWPRLAMSVYDTTWNGLFAALLFGRGGGGRHAQPSAGRDPLAMLAMGGAGSAAVGRLALDASAQGAGAGTGDWKNVRSGPTFDAARDMPSPPVGIRGSLGADLAAVAAATAVPAAAPSIAGRPG